MVTIARTHALMERGGEQTTATAATAVAVYASTTSMCHRRCLPRALSSLGYAFVARQFARRPPTDLKGDSMNSASLLTDTR
eukprot:scaffold11458_cov66-Phaeocystis_antarctica.AAC.4